MTAKILTSPHTKWIIIKVTLQTSKITAGDVYDVTMVNELGEIAHTYVDSSNRNQSHWLKVVELFDEGLATVVSGLKYKKDKFYKKTNEPLINADSIPTPIAAMSIDDAISQLYEKFTTPQDALFERL